MKKMIQAGAVLLVIILGNSIAMGAAPDIELQITDTVNEWVAGGELIQIGDYLITGIESIKQINKSGDTVKVSKSRIQVGSLIKATLSGKDENGVWLAKELIILKEQTNMSSESEKGSKEKTTKKSQDEIYQEDGVWKN